MKRTRIGYVVAALLGVSVLLPIAKAQAQTPMGRFVGTWKLNAAQTRPAPGESVPASLLTKITRVDPAHVHWSVTTVDPQGQSDTETFDTPGNGEFYSLDGETMVAHTLTPTTLQSTFKHVSGQTDVVSCTLSGTATLMTCTGMITRKDGSVARYSDVFDRTN